VAPAQPQRTPDTQEHGDRDERVNIPDQLIGAEETPQPSRGLPMPVQVLPSQPTHTVHTRPKPFKYHKDALKKLEEDYNLEVQASDDSDADEELGTAIDEVKRYFVENPDLAACYTDPEANQVQCPACNKTLGKTVFDVYQHANTSKSKHNLIHRGVAAAIAALHGDQAPPRRHTQVPREETRPNRAPTNRRPRS
jgi:hypothetical protein